MLLSYGVVGHLLFGTQMEEYSTLINSFKTTPFLSFSQNYFLEMAKIDSIVGIIYSTSFIIFVTSIWFNMFVAIINAYFIELQEL